MEASELAAAAVRVMTEDGSAGSGRKTAVQSWCGAGWAAANSGRPP